MNSKRLIKAHLQTLARGLELPTDASVGELRLMIEGKLRESGREPESTQVICGEEPGSIYLKNDNGVFFKENPYPTEETPYRKDDAHHHHPDDDTVDSGESGEAHTDTGTADETGDPMT